MIISVLFSCADCRTSEIETLNVNDNVNVNVSVNGDYILPSECARLDGNFNDEFQSFCAKWKISIDINSPLIADLDFIKLDKAYSPSDRPFFQYLLQSEFGRLNHISKLLKHNS